jgi:hypothetical protein
MVRSGRGDVDHRALQPGVQLADFGAHLHAHLRVEVGKRFVEQERLGLADDGAAADGHALALAAGEGLGLALEIIDDAQDFRRLHDALVDFRLGILAQLQAEGHVVVHAHVRIERVVLEDHRDVAVLRRDVVDLLAVDEDGALADVFEAGDHPQRGGLAAAGWADQHHEFLVLDFQVRVVHRRDVAGIDLVYAFENDFRHG